VEGFLGAVERIILRESLKAGKASAKLENVKGICMQFVAVLINEK
jgi:hypothetical protein